MIITKHQVESAAIAGLAALILGTIPLPSLRHTD